MSERYSCSSEVGWVGKKDRFHALKAMRRSWKRRTWRGWSTFRSTKARRCSILLIS